MGPNGTVGRYGASYALVTCVESDSTEPNYAFDDYLLARQREFSDQPRMASGHLTIDLHTQGQPPGCLPLGPRLTPASPLARLRPAGHVAEAYSPQS